VAGLRERYHPLHDYLILYMHFSLIYRMVSWLRSQILQKGQLNKGSPQK